MFQVLPTGAVELYSKGSFSLQGTCSVYGEILCRWMCNKQKKKVICRKGQMKDEIIINIIKELSLDRNLGMLKESFEG